MCSGTAAINCVQCNSGYILTNTGCTACADLNCLVCFQTGNNQCGSCPATFYVTGNTCGQCSVNCATCHGGATSQCLTCMPGYYLSAPGGVCLNCASSCASCTGQQGDQCSNCVAMFYYNSGKCNACSSHCLTCTGTAENQCTGCVTGYYLGSDGVCRGCGYTTCPVGSYLYKTCCVGTCPVGMYGSTARKCENCDPLCYTCIQTSTFCTSCTNDTYIANSTGYCICSDITYQGYCYYVCPNGLNQYLQTCVTVCPDGFYANIYHVCKACDPICATCVTTSTYCLTCSNETLVATNGICNCSSTMLYFLGDCYTSCPYYVFTYLSSCYVTCPNFLAGFLISMTCLNNCPDGYFNLTGTCMDCSTQCLNCTQCADSSLTLINGHCYDTNCPIQTYLSPQFICVNCDISCLKCNGSTANDCLQCTNNASAFFLFQMQCLGACPVQYYGDRASQSCRNCDPSCLTCYGSNSDQCLSCFPSNFLMQSNFTCYSPCPDGYYGNTNTNRCELCSEGCIQCLNYSYCLNCSDLYFLISNNTGSFCKPQNQVFAYLEDISDTSNPFYIRMTLTIRWDYFINYTSSFIQNITIDALPTNYYNVKYYKNPQNRSSIIFAFNYYHIFNNTILTVQLFGNVSNSTGITYINESVSIPLVGVPVLCSYGWVLSI